MAKCPFYPGLKGLLAVRSAYIGCLRILCILCILKEAENPEYDARSETIVAKDEASVSYMAVSFCHGGRLPASERGHCVHGSGFGVT